MPRSPRSVTKRQRHKKWLKRAKGYRGRRNRVFKLAKEAVLKAGQYAYRDRRKKKASFRQQWHIIINGAVRDHGLSYSRFTHDLRQQNIHLNRKMLAELAASHRSVFDEVVTTTKANQK